MRMLFLARRVEAGACMRAAYGRGVVVISRPLFGGDALTGVSADQHAPPCDYGPGNSWLGRIHV